VLLSRHRIDVPDNASARRIHTQVSVIRKVIVAAVLIIAIGSVLMLFDPVRQFGTSILASAGIVGIVVGFAAQKTLGNLLAGIQIALTQPLLIDDIVVVEGEFGQIEEITLTYVTVRTWDLRRMILPITYFVEKPFQNWSRVSPEVLGTVILYLDYQAPLGELRAELKRLVEHNPKWDGKVCGLQVTDTKQNAVEVRALVSSTDPAKAFDLRCEVREGLVEFLRRYHPESLPRVRNVIESPDEEVRRAKSKDGMEEKQSISVDQIQKMLGSEQVNALAARSASIPHKSQISYLNIWRRSWTNLSGWKGSPYEGTNEDTEKKCGPNTNILLACFCREQHGGRVCWRWRGRCPQSVIKRR